MATAEAPTKLDPTTQQPNEEAVADHLSQPGQQSVLLDTDDKLGGTAEQQGASGGGDDAGYGEGGSGTGVGASVRLSALAPTLGRMATVAHNISAPYLSYAAQASQEAARYLYLKCQ